MPRRTRPRTIGGEDTLARRVQFEREQRGWSPAGLAARMTKAGCPMSQAAIWKIENGEPRRRITLDEAMAFAYVFDVALDALLDPVEIATSKEAARLMTEIEIQVWALEEAADALDRAWGELGQIIGPEGPPLSVDHIAEFLGSGDDVSGSFPTWVRAVFHRQAEGIVTAGWARLTPPPQLAAGSTPDLWKALVKLVEELLQRPNHAAALMELEDGRKVHVTLRGSPPGLDNLTITFKEAGDLPDLDGNIVTWRMPIPSRFVGGDDRAEDAPESATASDSEEV